VSEVAENWLSIESAPAQLPALWEDEPALSSEDPFEVIQERENAIGVIAAETAEVPKDLAVDCASAREAWGRLSIKQQYFLRALRANYFNVSDTVRKLKRTPYQMNKCTPDRWRQNNRDYALVHRMMMLIAKNEAIDPNTLLLRAEEIAARALEETPVYGKEGVVGFKRDLKTALDATKVTMQTQKMLGSGESSAEARVKVSIVRLTGDWETRDAIDVAVEGEAGALEAPS
jgi:hypothetical protein